jgi:hypothetical protein
LGAGSPEKGAGSPVLAPPRGGERGDALLLLAERNGVGGEGGKADEWVPQEVVEMGLRYQGRWVREK